MRYKKSYFEKLTEEVTTIQIDYTTVNRIGEEFFGSDTPQTIMIRASESDEEAFLIIRQPTKIIRASRYSSIRGEGKPENANYDIFINRLATHAISESTLLKDTATRKQIATLTFINEKITEAWEILKKHNALWEEGKFQSILFESEFFPHFNIPGTQTMVLGIEPNFREGATTGDFFLDLQDAIIYKQRALTRVLDHLKIQAGYPSIEETSNPANHSRGIARSPANVLPELTFEDYLTEEGKKIFPLVKRQYGNSPPGQVVPVLLAMIDLSLLKMKATELGFDENYKMLTKTFDKLGTKEGVRSSVENHNKPGDKHATAINKAKMKIQKHFASLSII